MSNPEQNIRSLQEQLAYYSARKLTPASRREKAPAQIIEASAPTRNFRGGSITMAFKLATVLSDYPQGQELVYKATCPECRKRKITVQTIYKGRNALWPPEDGYPDKCETCQGGAV